MDTIKIELVDTDHVIRAKTDLAQNGGDDTFRKFLKQISEELVPGQTGYLEIEGSSMNPITFEISPVE